MTKDDLLSGIETLRVKYPHWRISDPGREIQAYWVDHPGTEAMMWEMKITSPAQRHKSFLASTIEDIEDAIQDIFDDQGFGDSS